MPSKHYRSDIDGLRAIAVLGVIFFHCGMPLPGGYVGVDVFFVISGFLITQIILRESSEQRFSLKQFWIRRIRRVLPAAALVTFTTLAFGYLVLDPNWFMALGKAAIAHSAMLANVFYCKPSGYFSEFAELQPLLHTWSLSVEEQFYVIFPLLLIFLLRRTRFSFLVLALIALASFVLSAVGAHTHPSATFYLLPARAWELLAGVLLAKFASRFTLTGLARQWLAFAGLSAILVPMVAYSESTPFPGVAALPPVLGSVVLIWTGRGSPTFVARILSCKIFVAIGLISYSLYLWHWPIVVFFKHMIVIQFWWHTAMALVLTAILSYLSWRFVEVPFRSSERLQTPRSAFTFGALVSGGVVAVSLLILFEKGYPSRLDPGLSEIEQDLQWVGIDYQSEHLSGVQIGIKNPESSSPKFALWGDSHGMVLAQVIDSIAKKMDLQGRALLSSGKPPVTGLWKPLQGPTIESETKELNSARLQWIIENEVTDLILVGRWRGMTEGYLESEIDLRDGKPLEFSMVVDAREIAPSKSESRKALARQFGKMKGILADEGIRIWVVLQVPSASRPRVARDFFVTRKFPRLNRVDFRRDTSRAEYEEQRRSELELFHSFQDESCRIVDSIDQFFPKGRDHLQIYSERAYYRDDDHLTRCGADFFLRSKLTDVLADIKRLQNSK